MIRVYRGLRLAGGATVVGVDGNDVLVADDARFAWGDSSDGALALATAILADHLGARPSRGVAARFAFVTVATWTADRWTLTSTEIEHVLSQVLAAIRVTCPRCGDIGRREVAPRLWRACECRTSTPPTEAA